MFNQRGGGGLGVGLGGSLGGPGLAGLERWWNDDIAADIMLDQRSDRKASFACRSWRLLSSSAASFWRS
jgi:hypothetical protein